MSEKMTILVTGCAGMIGDALSKELINQGYKVIGVDRKKSDFLNNNFTQVTCELYDKEKICDIFKNNNIDRVIHLAALAHTAGEKDLSYERYFNVNVECSKIIFNIAAEYSIPILFSSTADVYGFVNGVTTNATVPEPVTIYGKTKYIAECELERIATIANSPYTIFRFAPVYTESIKRDIQKRYYIKYPNIAYIVGKGTEYEFLSIKTAVERMIEWVEDIPTEKIYNVKDSVRVNTAECIKKEKEAGRAPVVLYFPRWLIFAGFSIIKILTGKNKYTFLLNKVVNPLITQ